MRFQICDLRSQIWWMLVSRGGGRLIGFLDSTGILVDILFEVTTEIEYRYVVTSHQSRILMIERF